MRYSVLPLGRIDGVFNGFLVVPLGRGHRVEDAVVALRVKCDAKESH